MIALCSVEGCKRKATSRGLCYMHYLRLRRKGLKGDQIGASRTQNIERFVEDCLSSSTDECIFPSFQEKTDYPCIYKEGKRYNLSCLVLTQYKGPRPNPNQVVRHKVCGNSRCCNPRHLEWGTEKENMADKKVHGTQPSNIGEQNPNRKITRSQAEDIRKRYRAGRGPYDRGNCKLLAKEYGISANMVRLIAKGENWK